MNHTSFRAIVVNETESKQFVRNVVEREVSSLPEGRRINKGSLFFTKL